MKDMCEKNKKTWEKIESRFFEGAEKERKRSQEKYKFRI